MTAVVVAVLGVVALGAAGTAIVRGGRAPTLAGFGLSQLALGLLCLVAGLIPLGIAQLALGCATQVVLLGPLAASDRPGTAAGAGWVRSWPGAAAAAALLGLLVAVGVSTGRAFAHATGASAATGHTLLLGYAVPVALAVVLVAMVAAIGAAVAVRDGREAAEAAALLAHQRRVAAQRARAAQRAAARAARRGVRP
ncbi:MAG TPA: hypothetical protein VMW47_02230 [Verrucomicrobiae bacterium]|nr:hypothetical protein [Verrucomicrobiae bacterium]